MSVLPICSVEMVAVGGVLVVVLVMLVVGGDVGVGGSVWCWCRCWSRCYLSVGKDESDPRSWPLWAGLT